MRDYLHYICEPTYIFPCLCVVDLCSWVLANLSMMVCLQTCIYGPHAPSPIPSEIITRQYCTHIYVIWHIYARISILYVVNKHIFHDLCLWFDLCAFVGSKLKPVSVCKPTHMPPPMPPLPSHPK